MTDWRCFKKMRESKYCFSGDVAGHRAGHRHQRGPRRQEQGGRHRPQGQGHHRHRPRRHAGGRRRRCHGIVIC